MGEARKPMYQVCTHTGYAFVKVTGRASYLNCDPLRRFLRGMMEEGHRNYVLDFADCSGLDSTFLGILVGVALAVRSEEEGSMTLLSLGERNLETVENLGIHRIAHVRPKLEMTDLDQLEAVDSGSDDEAISAREVCEAHKRLMELNESNARKFHDVVSFLEQRMDEGANGDSARTANNAR
ncbi:MAG: STAS domain-containing protein [Opitutae bacterium]|mgnify:FL=1|nr:STAS domain-containing protein [Opitutae bacterium]